MKNTYHLLNTEKRSSDCRRRPKLESSLRIVVITMFFAICLTQLRAVAQIPAPPSRTRDTNNQQPAASHQNKDVPAENGLGLLLLLGTIYALIGGSGKHKCLTTLKPECGKCQI